MDAPDSRKRIVILGAGFAGLYTAVDLEKRLGSAGDIEVTLISRENYFLVTPLLFEAGSGILDPRHVVSPVRRMLKTSRFVAAEVQGVDLERRVVSVRHAADAPMVEFSYDQLVVAVGGVTNTRLVPGSEDAMTFKTLADAIILRNHIIDLFERADVQVEAQVQRELLTFVIIGGGLVGVELMGEMQQFAKFICGSYPRVPWERARFVMVESAPAILPELEKPLAEYAAEVFKKRGVEIRTGIKVERMEKDRVFLPGGESIKAATIILAAGVAPSPLLEKIAVAKDKKGRFEVEGTMRCKSHPEVWGIGDCAAIPGPDGKPYPALAQHALREARVLATNLLAVSRGGEPKAFVYRSLGTLAALGHYDGVGRVWKFRVKGFIAWWVWRTYYLMQMPRWERRIRLLVDWTIALFFRYDVAKLDLGEIERRE